MPFIAELQRRNVFRVAVAYAIVGWLLLQVASLLLPTFNAPEWVMRVFVLVVMLGFPLAVILAWALELTPGGIRRERNIHTDDSITHITGRKLDFAIIGLLAIALTFVVVDNYLLDAEPEQVAAANKELTTTELTTIEPAAVQEGGKSIAVLPFVNMSSDPEQEYFSDGLSEEILNLLAKVPDLKVIGRTSSFAFKGKNEDLRGIGKALDVSTVLEGSVRKSGERVRITAQLIDVSSGAHLWSETYDRTLTDIFAVQDDVASEILSALEIHVGMKPARGRPTENTEAYSLFLKAKSAMTRWDAVSAEQILLKTVELDPMFAEAWESLAYTYWEQWGQSLDDATARSGMQNAASRALAINPDLVFARVFLESASTESGVLKREIEALERLLRKQANHPQAQEMLTWDLVMAGYFGEALGLAEYQVDLDPLSPNAQLNLYLALYASERIEEAIAALELADQLGSVYTKGTLAYIQWREKHYDISIEYYEAGLEESELASDWVRELHTSANNPVSGQAYLDQRIPEIIASVPEDRAYELQQQLYNSYLTHGFLDRYFELIFDFDLSPGIWFDASLLIFNGMIDRGLGFTADPRFLEIAKAIGHIDLWDQRGAPDFCEKLDGQWVCE